MNREYLLKKIKNRKSQMNMTIDNIAKLSKLGNRTVVRFFGGEDVKLSTLEKITNVLGLDFAGNEMVDIDILREQRAKERALYIVSLVQDTSALEMQGLEKREFLYGAYQKNLWAS